MTEALISGEGLDNDGILRGLSYLALLAATVELDVSSIQGSMGVFERIYFKDGEEKPPNGRPPGGKGTGDDPKDYGTKKDPKKDEDKN